MSNAPNGPTLAATLWGLTDELDRTVEELDFLAQGIATTQLDTRNGASFLIARVRDQLKNLSLGALETLKTQNAEDPS